jgi:hypothetical protein
LFVLAIALDGVDGALARATNQATRFGGLFDQCCDHIREVTVVSGLALYGALNPFLAGLYGLGYPATNLMLYLCNTYRTPIPFAVKSYLVVYPALFAWLWLDFNILSPALGLELVLMSIMIGLGLRRLRKVML